ncbi:MAG: RsmE family RNA methyltransferase [Minisyncoccia bacterium]
MKIHHFITPCRINGNTLTISDTNIVHHMNNVIRLHAGEVVRICNDSMYYDITLDVVSKKEVYGTINNKGIVPKKTNEVILVMSIIKGANFDLVVQKATEIGVDCIIPLVSERTIKKDVNIPRIQTIAREAAEQSERMTIPTIYEPIEFKKWAEEEHDGNIYFFDTYIEPKSENQKPKAKKQKPTTYLVIGPEGGWSTTEQNIAKEKGWNIYSIGTNILRAETAGIIGTYLAVSGLI